MVFFVFDSQVFDYIRRQTVLEKEPLERIALEGQLQAFKHDSFGNVDTMRDKKMLDRLAQNSPPPWLKG